MSLWGRSVIDRMKYSVRGYLKFPMAPCDDPSYWEQIYRPLGPQDVFEWGNVSYDNLQQYQYTSILSPNQQPLLLKNHNYTIQEQIEKLTSQTTATAKITTTFHETINVYPRNVEIIRKNEEQHDSNDDTNINNNNNTYENDEPILLVGCGNSKLGEDLITKGFYNGPVIQLDVSNRLIDTMNLRCAQYIQDGTMIFVQDDATELSSLNDSTINASIDKGLIDVLFCGDMYDHCHDIMTSIHRVLKHNGTFCMLSFSQPKYLLHHLLIPPDINKIQYDNDENHYLMNNKRYEQTVNNLQYMWSDIQVRKLDQIYLYRFVKAEPQALFQNTDSTTTKNYSKINSTRFRNNRRRNR